MFEDWGDGDAYMVKVLNKGIKELYKVTGEISCMEVIDSGLQRA